MEDGEYAYMLGKLEEKDAEITRLTAERDALLAACEAFRARHDAEAQRCNFTSCGCDACVSVAPAIASTRPSVADRDRR